jgi:hypothetical protein
MKTNYTTSKLFRIVFSALIALFSTSAVFAQTVVTTVFSDNFERTDLTPGGSPEVTYTIAKTGTALPVIENNMIRLPNVSGETARTWIMANTSNYTSPFNDKLELINADSLIWTFNVRQNYNGRLTGIDDAASRGIAVVLVASSSDLSTANGYALVNGGDAPINYRLVKFSNGLTTAANITVLQHGQTLTDNRVYMSIKLVFIPSSKTWKLYDRIDGPASGGSFADPTVETTPYTLAGAVVDATHTNASMNAFGFAHKYSGTTAFNFWADNYSAKTYKTDTSTGVDTNKYTKQYTATIVDGGIKIDTENAKATIFDSRGAIVNTQYITGSSILKINRSGLFILKMEYQNGEYHTEKLILQ